MTRCNGKLRYRDELGAMIALSSTARKSRKGKRNESRYYRCPDCAGFHLTSVPKSAMRRRRAA